MRRAASADSKQTKTTYSPSAVTPEVELSQPEAPGARSVIQRSTSAWTAASSVIFPEMTCANMMSPTWPASVPDRIMIVLVGRRVQALPDSFLPFFLPLDLLFDVVCFWALMLSTRLGLLRPCFLARFFADALSLGVDFLLVDFGFFLSQVSSSPPP